MKQELTQIFKNDIFGSVRVILINEKEYFVGKDIAEALGYSNASKAVSTHCKHIVKAMIDIAHSQNGNVGKTETSLISEGDVYRLIIKSKLPTAEKFEDWIMEEVLPSIRKHGAYLTPEIQDKLKENPNYITDLIQELEETSKQNEQLLHNYNDIRLMYQNCTNEVAEYVNAKLMYSKSGKVKCNDIYNHYCRWCRDTPHYEPYDKKQFEELLLERMVQGHSIKKDGNYYIGVKI